MPKADSFTPGRSSRGIAPRAFLLALALATFAMGKTFTLIKVFPLAAKNSF
jgi:hypothetical protein